MTALDFSRGKFTPHAHQVVGVEHLVRHKVFGIFDEPGGEKTKQVIDAAQFIYERGDIDRVIVVTPSPVVDVWFETDPPGELTEHLWSDLPALVTRYGRKFKQWRNGPPSPDNPLRWVITNIEYIRHRKRGLYVNLAPLLQLANTRTLLVIDESSTIRTKKSHSFKACLRLRKLCGMVWLMNGTPMDHSPMDMLAQGLMMDKRILGVSGNVQFRDRYCIMGGWQGREVIGWENLDDLKARFKPYCIRRLKSECLDLPEKLAPVIRTVALSPAVWRAYKAMRDDLITELEADPRMSIANFTITKILRLAQLTSGFIGGLEDQHQHEDSPDYEPGVEVFDGASQAEAAAVHERAVEFRGILPDYEILGTEKRDSFLSWFEDQRAIRKDLKVVVWSRFRPELIALRDELAKLPITLGMMWRGDGKAGREERQECLRLGNPKTTTAGPAVILGIGQTGSMGLNFTAASETYYMSNDRRLLTRLQTEERTHRSGQVHHVGYTDSVATGPDGQRTIDHKIVSDMWARRELVTTTAAAWIQILREE